MPGVLRGRLHACARGGKFLWYPTVLLMGHYVKLGIGSSYSLINGTLCEIGYKETFYFLFFGLSIKTSCRAALCRAAVLRCSCPGPVQKDPCQANKEAFVLTEQWKKTKGGCLGCS